MWTHTYTHDTDLSPDTLWPVIADVAAWPTMDHNIARLVIDAPPAPGVPFTLKPKGGPTLSFTIGRFEPPARYSDVCHLAGATMETTHAFERRGAVTTIRVDIVIRGPLAWFWGLAVGRRHAAGLPAQTARILAHARTPKRPVAA